MSGRHLTLAEIAAASRLPEDDPRRRHLDACPRCRTLHVRHQQFIAPPAHLPAAELRDAEDRLAEFLAREVAPDDATGHVLDPGRVRHERARTRGPWGWFGAPAVAFAAAALVVAGVLLVQRPGGLEHASGVLRGQASGGPDSGMVRMAPTTRAGGRVELRWRAVQGADRYEVRLYSPELRALAVLGTARETVLVLAPGAVAGAASGDTLLWRVAALRGEARIARTDLGILRLP